LSVYFSPNGGCEEALINFVNSAKESVHTAIYSFTNMNIANAYVSAIHRGVKVTVVMFKGETVNQQAKVYDMIEVAGGDAWLYAPPSGGLMHDKFTIVDGMALATGSFNYTENAEHFNDENLLIVSSSGNAADLLGDFLAQQYENNFQNLLLLAQKERQGWRRSWDRFLRYFAPFVKGVGV
jgi:phosphatidylserine/phosphatidylglycerophosphate/cardiolipin synthase-like enzyme